MNRHYLNGDKKAGPCSEETMMELRPCGVLTDETRVPRDGTEGPRIRAA